MTRRRRPTAAVPNPLDAASLGERVAAAEDALANQRLERREPSAEFVAALGRLARGECTFADVLAGVRARADAATRG